MSTDSSEDALSLLRRSMREDKVATTAAVSREDRAGLFVRLTIDLSDVDEIACDSPRSRHASGPSIRSFEFRRISRACSRTFVICIPGLQPLRTPLNELAHRDKRAVIGFSPFFTALTALTDFTAVSTFHRGELRFPQ